MGTLKHLLEIVEKNYSFKPPMPKSFLKKKDNRDDPVYATDGADLNFKTIINIVLPCGKG